MTETETETLSPLRQKGLERLERSKKLKARQAMDREAIAKQLNPALVRGVTTEELFPGAAHFLFGFNLNGKSELVLEEDAPEAVQLPECGTLYAVEFEVYTSFSTKRQKYVQRGIWTGDAKRGFVGFGATQVAEVHKDTGFAFDEIFVKHATIPGEEGYVMQFALDAGTVKIGVNHLNPPPKLSLANLFGGVLGVDENAMTANELVNQLQMLVPAIHARAQANRKLVIQALIVVGGFNKSIDKHGNLKTFVVDEGRNAGQVRDVAVGSVTAGAFWFVADRDVTDPVHHVKGGTFSLKGGFSKDMARAGQVKPAMEEAIKNKDVQALMDQLKNASPEEASKLGLLAAELVKGSLKKEASDELPL